MADELYIGLMSGTSLDGIDAALVRFKNNQASLVHSICLELPSELKIEIKSLVSPSENEIKRLMMIDVQLGQHFAKAVKELITQSKTNKKHVLAIGSHGQTIRHYPTAESPATLQVGDPNTIAEITGITTVADFRRRDMAAGGQGAPLVPAFHEQVFHHATKNRVILNLGGIANITILPSDKNIAVTGFDTGPANTLINHWIQQQQNKSYDAAGNWAKTGQVSEDLLEEFLSDDYFKLAPPKSTGTEYFNETWLKNKLAKFSNLNDEDIQASLTTLTTKSISDAINSYSKDVDEVIVCGGGVHNNFLLQQLQQDLPNIEINSAAVYGLDPDYIEATAFAWLAKQTMEHKVGNLPEVTGASRAIVLGGVYYS